MPAAPYRLPWTPGELDAHHTEWGCNAGPCAIAAATGRRLREVRAALEGFTGWVNPAMMSAALLRLGYAPAISEPSRPHRVQTLCDGINRVQWHGAWLAAGMHPAAAVRHTHWIAHRGGWVLCTATAFDRWQPLAHWQEAQAGAGRAYHITHHFHISAQPLTATP